MTAHLHDTHFHLDLYPYRQNIIDEVESKGVYTVAMTNAPSVFGITQDLIDGKKFWRAALGLHPELVESHGHEITLFANLLPQTNYVGEVGLDYVNNTSEERSFQRQVFQRIVELCELSPGKIVSIHSRHAEKDVIEVIQGMQKSIPILHWFSGRPNLLAVALESGCRFSVNTAMMKSEKGKDIISALPRDRILMESDGPFISVAKAPACPIHLTLVVEGLAKIWGIDKKRAAEQLYGNFREILRHIQQPETILLE